MELLKSIKFRTQTTFAGLIVEKESQKEIKKLIDGCDYIDDIDVEDYDGLETNGVSDEIVKLKVKYWMGMKKKTKTFLAIVN